jgi:Tol biopolymer transport system component
MNHSRRIALNTATKSFAVFALFVLTFVSWIDAHAAAPRKLSPPTTNSTYATRISTPANPANARAVFLARLSATGPYELWSAPIAGGTAVNLSGALVVGGEVSSFKLSKDGARAVFLATKEDATKYELYSVPIDGSVAAVKRSGSIVDGGNVKSYEISDDSARIVYRADKDIVNRIELYSVPIAFGAGLKIAEVTTAGRDIESFRISPDSTRVVFLADIGTANDIQELYSVGIASSSPIKISRALIAGGQVNNNYAITSDSARVAYLAEVNALGRYRLYSVTIAGGASLEHSLDIPFDRDVVEFQVTPDATRIVFMADSAVVNSYALYSVPINSQNSIEISRPASLYGEVREFLISPDSSRVIYKAAGTGSAPQQLHSVPVNSNAGATVCPQLVAGDDIPFNDWFQISPDSSRVIFAANIAATSTDRLFSAAIAGGNCVDISGTMVTNGNVNNNEFAVSPDSKRVVFVADKHTDASNELFSVPIAGGTATKISGEMNGSGDVARFVISTDSKWVAFTGTKDTPNVFELYSVALDGGGALLDIDGDGKVLATTDLLLILRYQLGMRGGALITNALGVGATRNTSFPVEQYLRRVLEAPSAE